MFRLAGYLGKSIAEVESWPSDHVSEWMAWDRISPLPDPWAIHGHLMSLIWNITQKKPREPADFIPAARPPRRPQTPAEIEARLRAWSAAMASHAKGR